MSDALAEFLERTLGDWADQAACRGVDPNIFHPDDADYAQARSYCDRCLVRSECLAHALEHNEVFGMWGGRTESSRRRARRQAHMPPPR